MSMNREQKRMLQRQGEVDAEGEPVRERRQPQQRSTEERTGFRQFVREIRAELRKVAWPSRSETTNYAVVVIITIVVMTALIAGLDWFFSNSILELFDV
ncbi:MAG: preprotein translocase subunit SecE [Acidimicrobiales bacterium]|jgi:preprotein translocase subunit SecE